MKAFLVFISVISLFAVTVWFLLVYVLVSDEKKIRWVIEKGRLGIENGSVFTLSNLLAADYQDSSGLDRAMVLGSLRELFQETKILRLIITKISISIQKDQSEAEVTFVFQTEYSGALPIPKELKNTPQTIRVLLNKNGNQWLVSQTSHDVRNPFR